MCAAHAIRPRDIDRLPMDFVYNTDEKRGKRIGDTILLASLVVLIACTTILYT